MTGPQLTIQTDANPFKKEIADLKEATRTLFKTTRPQLNSHLVSMSFDFLHKVLIFPFLTLLGPAALM